MVTAAGAHPSIFRSLLGTLPEQCQAIEYSRSLPSAPRTSDVSQKPDNPLWSYFRDHHEGPGIWKWEHYFEVYHRHLFRFVGEKVDLLEVGIFSGGSLGMWRSYFGEGAHIHGVDIESACRAYSNPHVTVHIGDQADRGFWAEFKSQVSGVDVVIDDGGHTPEQQIVTFEEMFPHIRPGGVYICEDVHGGFNRFAAYAAALTLELNRTQSAPGQPSESATTNLQRTVHSMHHYPFVLVFEKHRVAPELLTSPRHGTEWQPFL